MISLSPYGIANCTRLQLPSASESFPLKSDFELSKVQASDWSISKPKRPLGPLGPLKDFGNYATIMYMTTLPLADARAQLSKLVEEASSTHERIEITKNGHRAAVLMGADDYDSLIETIAVLSDAELLSDHLEGLKDIESGNLLTMDELDVAMKAAGRHGKGK
jgi:antitoxin YefM